MRRKTNEQFLLELREKHPTLQALGEYINGRTKILLKCNNCGNIFSATPGSLYMGHGCSNCVGTMKKSHEQFVYEMKSIHPTIEVLGKYNGSKKKVELYCKTCEHKWSAIPNALLRGKGCPKCAGRMRKTTEQFIEEMRKKHPNICVLGDYINNKEKVKCKCNHCGTHFYGIPHSMLDNDTGCPNCKGSKGEKTIIKWLSANNIDYIPEFTFYDCRDINPLPFDFYVPHINTVIEYDGKQHYEENAFFGGEEAFFTLQKHDKMKDEYCEKNNIHLIRIPYWDFKNINEILTKELAS